MRTDLSSGGTFVMKFIFPALWGTLWSVTTGLLFTNPGAVKWEGGGVPPTWAKWVFLALLIVGAVVIGRVAAPLKRVALEGDRLHISNYWREVSVPLSQIARVGIGTSWRVNNQPVAVVELATLTDFGEQISFLPASAEEYALLERAVARSSATTGAPAG
jgi:hypothetical protein